MKLFPKPLPVIDIEAKEDETGFTACEKVALKNAWRVIKGLFRFHAFNIFLEYDFFTAHEMFLEYFRGPDDQFLLDCLNRHQISLLNVFEILIEQGLDSAPQMGIILTDLTTIHVKQGIQRPDILLLANAVKDHMLRVLDSISSPTLVIALDKLCVLIGSYFDGEIELSEEKRVEEIDIIAENDTDIM